MPTPTAVFRIYNGSSDSDPLIYTSGVDAVCTIETDAEPLFVTLDDVDLDGGTYGSWGVDLAGDGSFSTPLLQSSSAEPADGQSGGASNDDLVEGDYTPVLHFWETGSFDGVDTFPVFPPVPHPTGSISVDDDSPHVGDVVTMTLDTYDNGGLTIAGWGIDWGNDEVVDHDAAGDPNPGEVGSEAYDVPWANQTLTATFFVTDDTATRWDLDTVDIMVAPVPTIDVTNDPEIPAAGSDVDLLCNAYDNAGYTVLGYIVNWGDGNTDETDGSEPVPSTTIGSHTYAVDGTYTINVDVILDTGSFNVASFDVLVSSVPTGTLTLTPDPTTPGVTVTATLSDYENAGLDIDLWEIQWGDSFADNGPTDTDAADGDLATHTYATGGTYTAYLFVSTDAFFSTNYQVATYTITIESDAPVPPSGSIRADPAHPTLGDPTTLFIDAFDPGSMTVDHWRVDWGDGSDLIDTAGSPPTGEFGEHTYADAGIHEVRLFVTDDDFATETLVDGAFVTIVGISSFDCASFTLETQSTSVVFDCTTPDGSESAVVWVWNDIDGWWEPPAPDRSLVEGLGIPVVAAPVQARWTPRTVTLTATALCGTEDALLDALNTLTALCDMLRTPGTLTSTEDVPKTLSVRLADRPSFTVLGEAKALQVTIPMIAHDPMRVLTSDSTRVL